MLTTENGIALMGGLFKFKRVASKEAASKEGKSKFFGSRKNFFEKNKLFRKKILTTENGIALMGSLFKFKRAASEEAASKKRKKEKFFEIY